MSWNFNIGFKQSLIRIELGRDASEYRQKASQFELLMSIGNSHEKQARILKPIEFQEIKQIVQLEWFFD